MHGAETAVVTLYYVILLVLSVYSVHRLHLVRLRRRTPPPARVTANVWPSLTIQLPLYNEPNVAARLLDAVAAIEYPGALDIQVLDDSTDETPALVAARVDVWRARGVAIAHLRRGSRDGYKASALAFGMQRSAAELFAVFDADFVPPRDVLLRMVPYFADARVGMVQARWTHLNREHSLLTRVQALFLDAHFAVESAARNFGGRFFNFNGTAGVWRRAAIEEAGGWSSSTLTEDLDLSYRAQMKGWSFVFLPDVEVPAELPSQLHGFQQQQHRWTKGSIQTARKLLGALVRGDFDIRIKCEALFHLTNNSAYLLTVLLALLVVPAQQIRVRHGLGWSIAIDLALFALSSGSVLLFYREGQRWARRPPPRLRELLAVLPVGIGMSMRNAAAVIEGLVQRGGAFHRTPKRGDAAVARTERATRIPWNELALTLFFAGVIAVSASAGRWASLPFPTLFASVFGRVATTGLHEHLTHSRSGA
ncbi:MAG: glycosyltransferase [Acidobacteria bacterium]|nr:glycosyltransferase [Acidobacteriota bacterium]MBV9477204.1 glycosyltransferase [Acidobacteriota bacterium]